MQIPSGEGALATFQSVNVASTAMKVRRNADSNLGFSLCITMNGRSRARRGRAARSRNAGPSHPLPSQPDNGGSGPPSLPTINEKDAQRWISEIGSVASVTNQASPHQSAKPGEPGAHLFKDYCQIWQFAMQSSSERKPFRYFFILINQKRCEVISVNYTRVITNAAGY